MKDDDLLSKLWSGSAADSRPSEQRRGGDKGGRRPPPAQRGEEFSPVFPADRVYQAFETSDRAERLHIVRAVGMSLRPAYHSLSDMREDVFRQSCFALIYYPFLTVEVYGANLGPVMHAIGIGKCQRIREFHRDLYDYPSKDQPFIESIRITATTEEPDTIPIANS